MTTGFDTPGVETPAPTPRPNRVGPDPQVCFWFGAFLGIFGIGFPILRGIRAHRLGASRRPYWISYFKGWAVGTAVYAIFLIAGISLLGHIVGGSNTPTIPISQPSAVNQLPTQHTTVTPKVTYPIDRSTGTDGSKLQPKLPPTNLTIVNDGTFLSQDVATPITSALLDNHWSAVCESNLFFLRNAEISGSSLWKNDMAVLKKGPTPCSGPLLFDGMRYNAATPDQQGNPQYESSTHFVWGWTFTLDNKVVGHRYLSLGFNKSTGTWLLTDSYSHTPPCERVCS